MHADSSTGVDFGLQTRQCLVYWSHSFIVVSWVYGGLTPENFLQLNCQKRQEIATLQDRGDGTSSV